MFLAVGLRSRDILIAIGMFDKNFLRMMSSDGNKFK